MTMAKYWRFLPLLAVGLTAYANNTPDDDKEVNRKNVIRLVMKRINNEHYAPKALDDQFSRIIWKKYLQALDGNKNCLLQSDVDALRKYETLIDDELENPSLEYFNAIYALQMQRLRELQDVYRTILAQPMNFKVKETIQPDRSNAVYPADEAARREVWRKSLKYQVLKKMLEIQQKDKNKSDAVAEKEARKSVLMSTDGLFRSLLSNTASDDRFSAYMNTITLEMDPHTNYMAPVDASLRESMMTHRYYGLGLELTSKEGDVVIKRVMPGGTAARSGLLQAEDHILSLSDETGAMIDITGMSIVEVSKMIRGENNSTLKLLVRKSTGVEKEVTVKRGEIKEDGNAAKSAVIIDGARKIGYIQLSEFYLDQTRTDGARCAIDVAAEIEKLKQQQVNGIIVDLRGNPGGSLDQVVAMTGLFVKTGPVVLERDRTRLGSYPIQNGDKPLYEGPLAVMVDEGSASASEIFSAAIQDYRRGIIVGSPSSYGKGTMQTTYPMGKLGDAAKGIPDISYGSLALTIRKFYRINGHTTQLNGVTPDVIFPSRRAYAKIKERDNESALAADTIEKAYYTPYPDEAELKKVAVAAQDRINRDSAFNVIKRDVEWLQVHDTPVYSLEKNAFKQQLNEIQSYNEAIDKAVKLPADKQLTIKGTSIKDATPDNLAKYQEWMNSYTKDRYLAGTVNILTDMIGK